MRMIGAPRGGVESSRTIAIVAPSSPATAGTGITGGRSMRSCARAACGQSNKNARTARSNTLDDDRHRLAAADAQRREAALHALFFHRVEERRQHARARCADRMAE